MNGKQFMGWLAHYSQLSSKQYAEKPLIMGILNVTPDSFSDGGKFLSRDRACEQAFHLISQGADLIDVGGQSTRPGAQTIPVEEELNRIIPIIQHLRAHSDICISIDTNKPEVMRAAIAAGANWINDVSALRAEGALVAAADLNVPVCLMHMQGEPENMQHNPHYPQGVFNEVLAFFKERLAACDTAGIDKKHLILDPGFGFGKSVRDNLYLVNRLASFAVLERPLLLGVSRKSTVGAILDKGVNERLIGSIALAVYAALQGVGIIRTHDVDETHQALRVIACVRQADDSQ